jgi:hypothetical protein
MENPEEVENVPMPGGIVVTKHQATLIEEAVHIVLLMMGGNLFWYYWREWSGRWEVSSLPIGLALL